MSKILIVEDEVAIADLEKDYLELSGFEVEIENDGTSGLARALAEEFDLFILDLMLPGIDGFEICKEIREKKNTPILMVSAKKDDIDKIRGLGLGADDYITKPFSTAELLARIRGNYRRIQYIQNNQQGGDPVFHNGSLTIDYQMQTVYVKEEEIHATPIEYKILCLLAKNLGRVLTHTHIAKEIWGSSLEGDIASLRVHVATVRKKIEKKDRSNKCIQTHIGIGYCMVKQIKNY